jgi:hypothetical protein
VDHALPRVNAVGSNSLLVAAVARLRLPAGSRTLSKEDERIKVAIEGAASAIGAPLLDAESLDDFGRRLDASVESKGFAGYFNQLAQAFSADGALSEQLERVDERSHEWVTDVLGEGQRALTTAADRMMRAMVEAFENLRRTVRSTFNVDVSPVLLDEGDPLGFLSDRNVPPRIAGTVLGTYYSNACFLAIASAGLTGRKLAPWLARAIAERWVQGLRGQLALLASFPGTHVDEDLIPRDQRLDLEAFVRENAEANAAMDQFHRDADEANVDVYAPDHAR